MANNTRARRTARLSRALGIALTPKAAKYMERRPYGPGEHGRARKKQDSDYAVRLREKQRLRAQYGIREAQMTRAFEEARRTKGLTGENLIELLEMRLDALVLRAGFARTIAQARQLVVHRHILVDGIRVDRPSFRVGEGQLVHVTAAARPCLRSRLQQPALTATSCRSFRPTWTSSSTPCRPAWCVAPSAPRSP